MLEWTTRAAACAHPPRPARYPHPRRAFRSRADLRRDVDLGTWYHGTFLGDHFDILMDHRLEGFPFNILRDPMYVGTICFAATALWCVSVVLRTCAAGDTWSGVNFSFL